MTREPIEVRRERLGLAIQQLVADLAQERRRRFRLERELRDVRSRLARYEPADPRVTTPSQRSTSIEH
jgi:hypothetical protein